MKTVQDVVAEAKNRIREITQEQMLERQARGAQLVDMREPAEFAVGSDAVSLAGGWPTRLSIETRTQP